MSKLTGMAALNQLLNPQPSTEDLLDLHLRHQLEEILDWRRRPTMLDGLERDQCRALVEVRASQILGDEELGEMTADLIALLIPIAHSLEEVDSVIRSAADWVKELTDNDCEILDEILTLKKMAHGSGFLAVDQADLSESDFREWQTAVQFYIERTALSSLSLMIGGREAKWLIEPHATLALIQDEGYWTIVYAIPHSDGGGGWDDGDDDPEPEPTPDQPIRMDA